MKQIRNMGSLESRCTITGIWSRAIWNPKYLIGYFHIIDNALLCYPLSQAVIFFSFYQKHT